MKLHLPLAATSLLLGLAATTVMASARKAGQHLPYTNDPVVAALLFGDRDGSPDPAMNPCGRTAHLARKARVAEARDDFLIALGNCVNVPDPDDQDECVEEAIEEYGEALEEADEQHAARLDLCALLGGGIYAPEIDPEDFVDGVDHPYLPLVPGTTLVYEGETTDDDGNPITEVVRVTTLDETIEIMDVECVVVRDTVTVDDELVEDTLDYFAQDEDGNVWYFGEIALNYEEGRLVDIEGSWEAGEDGAQPGIVMLAAPLVGDTYRQEWLLGEAEDAGTVLSLNESVVTPYDSFDGCLQTGDFTPLEPGVLEHKYYAPGIGMVKEVDPDSGETLELVAIES